MGRYAYSRPPRRDRQGGGCLRTLAGLLFLAGLLALIYLFALGPFLNRDVGGQLDGQPAPLPTLMPPGAQPVVEQAVDQAAAAMPTAVAAMPSGELVITDADVNGLIAANPEAIAPLERMSLRFTGGRVVADIAAFGMDSSASAALAAQDGQIVVSGATIDGPLAVAVSGDTLARALADRLNAELAAQGRRVDDLRVEEGRLILLTS